MTTQNDDYLIYGAGNTGRRVLEILSRHGKRVLSFIDANATRLVAVEGLAVQTIQAAAQNLSYRDQNVTVIIAVFNPLVSMRTIISSLTNAGFSRIIDFYSFYRRHSMEIGDLLWLSSDRSFDKINIAKINEVRALLADQESRQLFDQMIEFRRSLDIDDLPLPEDVSSQYFPSDIPVYRDDVYFVDCGAFDGDTVSSLGKYFRSIKGFECFEPDPANFAKMVKRLDGIYSDVNVYKRYHMCGVTSENKVLKFHPEGTAGRLSATGDVTVKCVALDDVLPTNLQRAYLKMDIEGSELEALVGGEQFIRNGIVDVAICVYHSPGHIWEVPLYLKKMHSDYRLYIRLYGENLMESVFYGLRS